MVPQIPIVNKILDIFIQENLTHSEAENILREVGNRIDHNFCPKLKDLEEQNREMFMIRSLLGR